ncbi:amino acid lyase, partial [Streptococcus suis]
YPDLIEALIVSNEEGLSGYGSDRYTQSAIEKIRQATACPHAQVTFFAGGTQTNQVVIDALLQSYEGVIAAETGHIAS